MNSLSASAKNSSSGQSGCSLKPQRNRQLNSACRYRNSSTIVEIATSRLSTLITFFFVAVSSRWLTTVYYRWTEPRYALVIVFFSWCGRQSEWNAFPGIALRAPSSHSRDKFPTWKKNCTIFHSGASRERSELISPNVLRGDGLRLAGIFGSGFIKFKSRSVWGSNRNVRLNNERCILIVFVSPFSRGSAHFLPFLHQIKSTPRFYFDRHILISNLNQSKFNFQNMVRVHPPHTLFM